MMEKPVRRRDRRVSFAPFCGVRHHLHKNDMTRDEISFTWISRAEQKLAETEARSTIGYMRHRPEQVSEENGRCGRGLEHHVSTTIFRTRRKIKQNVMNAVFIEQERQHFNKSLPNADAIRSASRYHSRHSEKKAIKLAEADAEYVTSMMIEEELYWETVEKDNTISGSLERDVRRSDSMPWEEWEEVEEEKGDKMSGLIERRASRRHSLQMGEEEKGQEEAEGDNISHQIVRRQQRRHSMPATLNPWTTGTAA